MARVKLCTNCRTIHPANKTSCPNCRKDLKGRPLSEEDAQKQLEELIRKEQEEAEAAKEAQTAQETAAQEVSATSEQVRLTHYRLCDCGHRNPVAASDCERCGESLEGLMIMTAEPISQAMPTPVTAPTPAGAAAPVAACMPELGKRVILASHDNMLRLTINGRVVLGANNEGSAYFYDKRFVGGCHAAITAEQDGVYLEDMNSRNGTFVNGNKISPGQRVRLENGAQICLGGPEAGGVRQKSAYFTLEIGV